MKYADLHIHSTYSDGNMTPEQIVEKARELGIKAISITDHDSIASQHITEILHDDINIIPGIELSAEYENLEVHILGYFINKDDKYLNDAVERLNKARLKRIEEIIFKLKSYDINLTLADLNIKENSTIGRSHIANAMVSKGYFDNYKVAFTTFLVQGKPAYVKGYKLDFKEAIKIISSAEGIPVLAHPGQIYRSIGIENLIRDFKCYGLKGIEVYHPSHSLEQTNKFFNLAKKYKLLITGGSDCHGKECLHDNSIGSFGISEDLLNRFTKCKKIY